MQLFSVAQVPRPAQNAGLRMTTVSGPKDDRAHCRTHQNRRRKSPTLGSCSGGYWRRVSGRASPKRETLPCFLAIHSLYVTSVTAPNLARGLAWLGSRIPSEQTFPIQVLPEALHVWEKLLVSVHSHSSRDASCVCRTECRRASRRCAGWSAASLPRDSRRPAHACRYQSSPNGSCRRHDFFRAGFAGGARFHWRRLFARNLSHHFSC